MKYYDLVISLGQYCITSTALRRLSLQNRSYPFDWSGGILEDVAGKGGLSVKVDLICNNFDNFFNFNDFENRGNNQENDTYNLWIVNKKTGLQYKHDFQASIPFENQFEYVKDKYKRIINRLYKDINNGYNILFIFIARDDGFSDNYLIDQQRKLSNKFKNKNIDMLYIINDNSFDKNGYNIKKLNNNITRIDMNMIYTTKDYPESWNGNTELYYKLIENMCYSHASIQTTKENIKNNINEVKNKLHVIFKNIYKLYNIYTVRYNVKNIMRILKNKII